LIISIRNDLDTLELDGKSHELKPYRSIEQVQDVKILGSECQTSGTHAKRAKQATEIDDCLCFLNYLAFLRPAADRDVSILPWIVSPGRSYGFLWAGSIIQKKCEEGQSNSGLFAS
jgi:hypothetical protein